MVKTSLKSMAEAGLAYGAYFPIGVALVPFTVAYVSTILFTAGNVQATNYLVSRVGIINIWLNGLIVGLSIIALSGLMIGLFVLLRIRKNKTKVAWLWTGVLAFFAFLIVPIGGLIAVIAGVSISEVRMWYRRKTGRLQKRTKSEMNDDDRFMASGVLIVTVVYALASYPMTLNTILEKSGGSSEHVKILADKEDEVIVISGDSHRIETIKKSVIEDQTVCHTQEFLSSSIRSVIRDNSESEIVEKC